jgi:hypothetical protein
MYRVKIWDFNTKNITRYLINLEKYQSFDPPPLSSIYSKFKPGLKCLHEADM